MREEVFSLPTVRSRIRTGFVAVAISVPSYLRRKDGESKLYRSLTRQAPPPTSRVPVPQGLCVVTLEGKVLEWVQVFEEQADILAFLERNAERFKRDPRTRGTAPVPGPHDSGSHCAAKPPPQRGSLRGVVTGRALDALGQPSRRTLESHRIDERLAVPRDRVEALWRAVQQAKGQERFAIDGDLLVPFLREVHLGNKDVRLFDNPLRGRTSRRGLRVEVQRSASAPSLLRLQVTTKLTAEKKGIFRHDQDLTWSGFLETDAQGIRALILVGAGRYELTWRGFDREEDRFRSLMAGRRVDLSARVRFAVVLERPKGGAEQAESGAPPASLRHKVLRFQKAMKRARREGRDLRPVAKAMRGFEQLIKDRKLEEAEQRLDQALSILEPGD